MRSSSRKRLCTLCKVTWLGVGGSSGPCALNHYAVQLSGLRSGGKVWASHWMMTRISLGKDRKRITDSLLEKTQKLENIQLIRKIETLLYG